ncbi:hypothetical protein D5V19_07865, partial [Campylobacter lari]|nr:hypothetical protein [Campylobacter lari]
GFMDETGVLINNMDEKSYFGLGLLRLHDTSRLLQEITAIKAKHKGIIQEEYKKRNINKSVKIGELKFNSLKSKKYLQMYKDIVDACFTYEHFYFSAILINRSKIRNKNKNTWNLYLSFAKAHIKEHCKKDNNSIAIIADYLNKPKNEPFFEDEMRKLKHVFNASMLESETSIFIQLVDIFIGAIICRYKHLGNIHKKVESKPKMQLVKYIEEKLEQKYNEENLKNGNKNCSGNYEKDKTLKGKFTIFGEKFYFSVYEK